MDLKLHHWKLMCDKIKNKNVSILIELIDLAHENDQEEFIQSLFHFIELLAKCRLRPNELKKLIELLKPSLKFKYCTLVLQTLLKISKSNPCILLTDHLFDFIYSENKIPLSLLSYDDLVTSHFNKLPILKQNKTLKWSNFFINFNTQNSVSKSFKRY